MINGLTSIAVGIYLLAVLFHMNHNALLAELMEESGFLKWGAAVIILLFIAEKPAVNLRRSLQAYLEWRLWLWL